MTIQLRNLRSFIAVATAGSISKAAEMIHIAQPALSVQLRQIEQALGAPLFERFHRGVTLTPAGERFLVHARDILRLVDVAVEDVRDAMAEPEGRVALGLPQSMARLLALPLVKMVTGQWPKVELHIVEMNTGYIAAHLLSRDIDLGMTFRSEENTGVAYTHLADEELVFVSSAAQISKYHRGPAGRSKSIRAADLSRFPIIMPTRAHSLRRRIEECLQDASISLNVIAQVNAIPQLTELAAAGVASTILSRAAVEGSSLVDQLAIMAITQPAMTRPVYLCRASAFPMSIAVSRVSSLIKALIADRAGQAGRLPASRDAPPRYRADSSPSGRATRSNGSPAASTTSPSKAPRPA